MAKASLRIQRIHSIELSVHEAGSWLGYLTRGFGFQHVAVSSGPAMEATGSRRHLLACGDVRLVLQEPVHGGSAARRFLDRHPEGISRINFLVEDVQKAEEILLERNATCTDFIQGETLPAGQWRELSIATPLGDVEFTFVESPDASLLSMPGLETCAAFDAQHNPLRIVAIDHLTAHVRTLMPVLAFYQHVLGFKRFWDVRFHTEDLQPGVGSGLTSVVMCDEKSGIKLATNEPLRPRYAASQVQLHVDVNRGPGIQHMALGVASLTTAVEQARTAGVQFLPTPATYYTALAGRLQAQSIPDPRESIEDLATAGALLDGDKDGYLLQIFCRDQASQFGRPTAGPVLLELVQRSGSKGFGEGNFRALFEAMRAITA
jgi:4-hydroxyphenylpyruvate dioxygenase